MPLETGDQIGDLVPANPFNSDPKSEGAGHLRLVKECVQGSLGLMEELLAFRDNNVPLRMRNAADDAYLDMIRINADDEVEIGVDGVVRLPAAQLLLGDAVGQPAFPINVNNEQTNIIKLNATDGVGTNIVGLQILTMMFLSAGFNTRKTVQWLT